VVVAAGSRWWQMWVAHDFAYRLLAELRTAALAGLGRMAPRFIQDKRTGDLSATAMSDVEVTERFFAHTVADLVVAVGLSIAACTTLLFVDPRLGLAVAPFVFGCAFVPLFLSQRAGA